MKNKELYELISSLEENANDVKNLLDCSLLIADNSERSYAMNKIITLLKKGIETIEVMSDEIASLVKDDAMKEVFK
ncbi:hypothetical protein ACNGFG_08635 [Campylobacter coli]